MELKFSPKFILFFSIILEAIGLFFFEDMYLTRD
jgi:hypothetical protein